MQDAYAMLKAFTRKCPTAVKIIHTRFSKEVLQQQRGPVKNLVALTIRTYELPNSEIVNAQAALAYYYQKSKLGDSYQKLYWTLGQLSTEIELEERPKQLFELLVEFDEIFTDFVGTQKEIYRLAVESVEKRPVYIA